MKEMKICHMFDDDVEFDIRNLEFIRNYGDECNGHYLFAWDEGNRSLYRCKKCGAYVLKQYSEIHMPDSIYVDYFPVRDEELAEEVNRKYDGWSIEENYPYKGIFYTIRCDC